MAAKAVFNGSRLGKEFSAGVFNDLFAGQDTTGLASQQHQPEHSHITEWQEQHTGYRPDHKDGTTQNVAAAFNPLCPRTRRSVRRPARTAPKKEEKTQIWKATVTMPNAHPHGIPTSFSQRKAERSDFRIRTKSCLSVASSF